MIINSNELYQLQQLCDSKHKIKIARTPIGEAFLPANITSNRWAVELIYEWRARHPLSCQECKDLAAHSTGAGHLAGGLG